MNKSHPAIKHDMLVNSGALQMAINVLERAGKYEVVEELKLTMKRFEGDTRTENSVAQQLQVAKERIQELEEVCGEAYQVVGCLLDDLGDFNSDRAEKILDNLSLARMKHKDVLPWESINPNEMGT